MNRYAMIAGLCSVVALSGGVFAAEQPKPPDTKPADAKPAAAKSETGGKDEGVAIADIPKAVVDAVNKAQAGGKITEAEKETRNGVLVYEVEVSNNGKKYEVKVDATGKLLSNKEDDEDDDEGEVEKKK